MSKHVYVGVHVFHTDIDECQSLSTCANGICLNSEGSYTCENCPTGYRVSYNGELCEGWFINTTHLNGLLFNICIYLIFRLVGIVVLPCHHEFRCFFLAVETPLSCNKCLIVCVVSCQILMSVCCPLHAPKEHVQTQRVPSHVSSVNLVSESLRTDNSATVRLLAVFVQECALLCLYTCTQVRVASSFIQTCQALPPYLTESLLRVNVPRAFSQLVQVVCKQHQV